MTHVWYRKDSEFVICPIICIFSSSISTDNRSLQTVQCSHFINHIIITNFPKLRILVKKNHTQYRKFIILVVWIYYNVCNNISHFTNRQYEIFTVWLSKMTLAYGYMVFHVWFLHKFHVNLRFYGIDTLDSC